MNKKLLSLFVLFVFFVSVNMKTLTKERVELKFRLQRRDGIIYIMNEEEPYTGVLVDYYKNGQIKIKGNYKAGKPDGEFVSYYENGEIKLKEYYKYDKRLN